MVQNVKPLCFILILGLLVASCVPPKPTPKPPQTEDDFYFSNGEKIPITIALNQIGIVANEGVASEQIEAFASELGLELIREVSESMFILGLSQPLKRDFLTNFTREVKRRGEQLLREAGLVIGDLTPMLLTDEFIALFNPEVTQEQIDELNRSNNVEIVSPDPFVKNQYLFRVIEATRVDALGMANQYHESPLTKFSHPNFWLVLELNGHKPKDPLFGEQWHLDNTGQGGGTADADVDAPLAWNITMGSPGVVIAVLDNGFDLTHEDLAPNLFTNPGEKPKNGKDDDKNGFVDDVNGWDFVGNDPDPSPGSAKDNHGTAVAGIAAARGDNKLGVIGICPYSRFLPIRMCCTNNVQSIANAIAYGASMAQILNNSWGISGIAPTNILNAINDAATKKGRIVFFSAGNESRNTCFAKTNFPATPEMLKLTTRNLNTAITVSSSTNVDKKETGHGFGNCIDLLAPSWGWGSSMGTRGVTTTDRTGTAGYNNSYSKCTGGLKEPTNTNYTNCFTGTSAASPLAAGIAGLVLSANSTLTRVQVQRLLQDTADKIEPGVAAYADNTGFSSPATGVATHSWGRINAFEAVRIAAPVKDGGKDGVDIFIRDNRLDWGNTEQPSNTRFEPTRGFIPHWQSMDIKVDAPPYKPAPKTSVDFDAFVDENPVSGKMNRVYVRVRNRGPVTASNVTVKLHWAFAGTGLPKLPTDFWNKFPGDSKDKTKWHPLSTKTITSLAYSGSSVAGCPGRTQPPCAGVTDAAQIVQFDFKGPKIDPTKKDPNHHCLLVIIDSKQDPINPASKATLVVDKITPNDNNVTHRNVKVEDTSTSKSFSERFFVGNPTDQPVTVVLRLRAPLALEQDWTIELSELGFDSPFVLDQGQQILVTMEVIIPEFNQRGEVTIIQERVDTERPEVMGGMTYQFLSREAELE